MLKRAAVESTAELDYSEALDTFGLRFKPVPPQAPDRPAKIWLGITTRNDNGRLVVTQVQRGSPADVGGINVDDEILAIDDFRVRADRFENRLEQYKPGDKVSVLVARREQLLKVDVPLAVEPVKSWRLEANPNATEIQRRTLDAWLRGQS